jgi:hypothetical protein
MNKNVFFMLLGTVILFNSCGSMPKSFVRTSGGGEWSSILISDEFSYNEAFNEVVDVIAKRFEMDMISKEGGYGRSQWSYTWNDKGKYLDFYRTRVIFKFSANRTKVDIKTEAEYLTKRGWLQGFDTRLLETIKRDVMGTISRTTF